MSFNIISISEQDKKLNKVIEVIDKKAKKERTKTIEEGEKAYAEKQIPSPELSLEGSGWIDLGDYEKGDCEQE